MKVLAYDPFVTEVPEEFRDFVSVELSGNPGRCERQLRCACRMHLPLTDETRNMISARELGDDAARAR